MTERFEFTTQTYHKTRKLHQRGVTIDPDRGSRLIRTRGHDGPEYTTAIDLAKKHFGHEMTIHHGSVTEMPFDTKIYDGIYCYGLIYLLDKSERLKLIQDCYNQLADNGVMVFTAITKEAQTYGQGKQISKDRFEMFGGVQIFFYDKETIDDEFGMAGLFEVSEVSENYPFYLIKCRKAVFIL